MGQEQVAQETGRPARALSRGDHGRLAPPRRQNRPRSLRPGRTGSVHAVVGAMLAVIALVGCVVAILLLAAQPTATRLEQEVASLTHRLDAAQGELAALRTAAGRSAAQSALMAGGVRRLTTRVAGLQRTVRGLQSSTTLTQQQAAGLRACVPQLQRELAGLTLRTRSVGGQLRSVGLSDGALLSPGCRSVFSGL